MLILRVSSLIKSNFQLSWCDCCKFSCLWYLLLWNVNKDVINHVTTVNHGQGHGGLCFFSLMHLPWWWSLTGFLSGQSEQMCVKCLRLLWSYNMDSMMPQHKWALSILCLPNALRFPCSVSWGHWFVGKWQQCLDMTAEPAAYSGVFSPSLFLNPGHITPKVTQDHRKPKIATLID